MSAAWAVELRGLGKRYRLPRRGREWLKPWRPRRHQEALAGVDLAVAPGELVALLGPNGAGKTTLLKILAGLVSADAGEARVHGADVARDPELGRARVGYVLTDERSFFWRLTVRDNLRFFAGLEGLFGAEAAARVEYTARLLGLGELLDRRFNALSAGQKQRVALARGLLADPPVLVFDEVTRALDPGRAEQVRRLVRELIVERQGRAVLFATHDLAEARAIADRVVLLSGGKVACEGPFDAVEAEVRAVFRAEAEAEEGALSAILQEAR
ncbi:MAG: ABC transporter ATP-binding protein [Deltaproteobacteria bacterium]|nr:ABC transporter ATP-binding protein [Deltaproteobacteria bacterium]